MPAPLRTFNLGDGSGGKVRGEGDTWEKSVYPCDDKGGLSRMCVKKCAEGRRAVLFLMPSQSMN